VITLNQFNLITIFSTPKNFEGIFDIIQTNAINSWRAQSSDIEIIIFGDSKGSKEIAKSVNAVYVPNVKTSNKGVPLLSDLFKKAEKIAENNLLIFINSDILLPFDFFNSIKKIKNMPNKYLMVGHRWDCDVEFKIDFFRENNYKKVWDNIFNRAKKHLPSGIDYFIFKKKTFKNIPDFSVGRPGYDNWIIWYARRRLIPVIDLSDELKVIHQNHHYRFHNLVGDPKIFIEEDGARNKELIGENTLNLCDANFFLSSNRIMKNTSYEFLNRNLGKLEKIYPELYYLFNWYKRIKRRIFKKI
jgi:hypothetical protein